MKKIAIFALVCIVSLLFASCPQPSSDTSTPRPTPNPEKFTLTLNPVGGEVSPTSLEVIKGKAVGKLPNPTKEGYNFTGWTIENLTIEASTIWSYTTNKTAIANWTERGDTPYTIKHYQQNIIGDEYTLVKEETLTGVKGATIRPSTKSYFGFISPVLQTSTINADGSTVVEYKYNRTVHTITYVVDGEKGTATGNLITENLRYGTSTPIVTVTANEGYTYIGWSTAVKHTVTGNTTYTAQFTANIYTITFDSNDGTVDTDSKQVTYGSPIGELPIPTRTGYSFVTWRIDEVDVTNETKWSFAQNKTVSAIWAVKRYTLRFNASGANIDTETIEVAYGEPITHLPIPESAPYSFLGWQIDGIDITNETIWNYAEDKTATALGEGSVTLVRASITGREVTIVPDTKGTTLKEALHAVVNDDNRPNIASIIIDVPNGIKLIPETDLSYLFSYDGHYEHYNSLKTIEGLEKLDTSLVTNMNNMFAYCSSLTSLDVSSFNTSEVTDMGSMFLMCESLTGLDVSSFNTEQVRDMRGMFNHCKSLASLDVSGFKTSQVVDMGVMFSTCESLTNLDVSNFDTSQVTDMAGMFYRCESLANLNISSFDTSQVTSMAAMFYICKSLTNLNVSSFDTSQVTSMERMFYRCGSLTSLDVSNFVTSQVTDMTTMFWNCLSLTSLDLSNFDTSKVMGMSSMFHYSYKLRRLDLSNWNTSKVTTTSYAGFSGSSDMFSSCHALTQEGIITNEHTQFSPAVQARINALPLK